MGAIYIGTSGFSYREWIGRFYPPGIKPRDMLSYYAAHFNTVEVNNTFYRIPQADTLKVWRDTVGPGFQFAVKASQMITHRRDFGIPDGYFELFLTRIAELQEHLGPVLFQFPPSYGDRDHFNEFIRYIKMLMPGRSFIPVIELRNKKLLNPDFFFVLRENRLALCCNDGFLKPGEWPEPAEVVYLRLRNGPYQGDYLRQIAVSLKQWAECGKDCYVFFKHEEAAPELANDMVKILGQPNG